MSEALGWATGPGFVEFFQDKGEPFSDHASAESWRQRHLLQAVEAMTTLMLKAIRGRG